MLRTARPACRKHLLSARSRQKIAAAEASPSKARRYRAIWESPEHPARKPSPRGRWKKVRRGRRESVQSAVASDLDSARADGAADGNVDGGSVFAVEGRGAWMFGVKFGTGFEEANAAIPAEDAVVIAGGTDFFGFGEAA